MLMCLCDSQNNTDKQSPDAFSRTASPPKAHPHVNHHRVALAVFLVGTMSLLASRSTSPSSAHLIGHKGGAAAPGGKGSGARDMLMVSLSRFYSQKNNMQRVLPYITCSSDVSLRLIDWFVTNFSKKNNTILGRTVQGNMMHFNVYLNYRAQLKAYSKQQFDPFRRRDRVMFFYDRNRSVETTVGQLNFFRWMLQNDVLDYVVEFASEIETDMVHSQKVSSLPATSAAAKKTAANAGKKGAQEKKDAGNSSSSSGSGGGSGGGKKGSVDDGRKKRVELSQCKATRNMTRMVGDRTVLFD